MGLFLLEQLGNQRQGKPLQPFTSGIGGFRWYNAV